MDEDAQTSVHLEISGSCGTLFFNFFLGGMSSHSILYATYYRTYCISHTHDDECGAVNGMGVGRQTEVLGENMPQCQFSYHSPMILAILAPGLRA